MRPHLVRVLVLGVWMAWPPAAVLADNVVGVTKARAEQIAQLLAPGQVLIWNCPTCPGLQVMRVEQIRVTKYGNSPEFAVMIKRDLLISSRKTFEALPGMRCADPTRQNPDEEREGWAVDLTYAYAKSGGAGTYLSVGRLVGADNNPVPTITLTKEALANIERCIAKRRRSPNAIDEAGDPLVERLTSRSDALRVAALEELKRTVRGKSRLEQEQLMAALIEEMADVGTVEEGPGNSKRAQDALLQAAPVAAPYLIRTVTDANEDVVVRDLGARTLGRMGPAAGDSVPALVAMLKSEFRSPPRAGVAFALGALGVASPPVIQALTQALAYRDPNIPGGIDLGSFSEIAIALKKLGGDWKGAVPVLLRFLNETDAYDRIWAAVTLLQLDPSIKRSAEVLSEILKDPSLGQVHDHLLVAIQEAGPAARDVVPALIEALDAKNRYLDREKLLRALERIGTPEAREAVRRSR